MADVKKVTKAQVLVIVKAMAEAQEQGVDLGNGVTAEDIIAYVDTTIGQMAAKAEKAAEKRAEKKAEGAELKELVLKYVDADPHTRDEIAALVQQEADLSVPQVGARLTQLVNEGLVVKESAIVDKAKKMVYKLA